MIVRLALIPFVAQIILFGGYVQRHDVSADREEVLEGRASLLGEWCDDQTDRTAIAAYPEAVAWFAKLERLSASPGAIKPFILLNYLIYVSSVVPTVRVPRLVLHSQNHANVPVELGRELASQIPNAKLIEYPEGDHVLWSSNSETRLGDVEAFITGMLMAPQVIWSAFLQPFFLQTSSIQNEVQPR